MVRIALLFLLAFLVLAPADLDARCNLLKDVRSVGKSVTQAVRCNDKVLRRGPAVSCKRTTPPACADTLVHDAVALGYGPNDPATSRVDRQALRSQLACQKQIGRAIRTYVRARLIGLVKGQLPSKFDPKARKQLDRIPLKCAVNVAGDTSGVVLPAVGPQCAAAVGPAGNAVDPGKLRDCLLTLGEVWVDRIGPNPQPLRPNILFILTDDQRWDTTDGTHSPSGAFIMPRVRAELADSGVEFRNAFMTTPLCCPSRSSILTGEYAHRTGVFINTGTNGGADDFHDSSTIGTWLQAAGYRTGFMGKYLNGYNQLWSSPSPPYVPPGWDEWHVFRNPKYFDYALVRNGIGFDHVIQRYGSAETDYSTDVLRELARDFIKKSVAMGQPFYLQLNLKAPHLPLEPAPRHVNKFAGIPPWRPASFNEEDVSDKPTWVQSTPQLSEAAQAAVDNLRLRQLEMLQAEDEAIGGSTEFGIPGLMETLRDLGIADDTIVIYFADNGYQWGEHRMQAKNKPYEESIRAPMIVRYPKLAPLPRTDDELVLNIDIASTVAELAGATPPIVQDGVSLVRRIDDTAPDWRTDFLTEGWPASHVWATVREQQWKYTELPVTPGDPSTTFEYELYDLVADPLELTNVASDPANAARIATMAARLRELRPLWPADADPLFEDPDDE